MSNDKLLIDLFIGIDEEKQQIILDFTQHLLEKQNEDAQISTSTIQAEKK